MNLIACGLNHKTTPLHIREKAYFSPENAAYFLQTLLDKQRVEEAILLSTCNRTEIYCLAPHHSPIIAELANHSRFESNSNNLATYSYAHYGPQAVSHMTRVASGLDSMLIGEPQILGQLKQAVQLAQSYGTCQRELKRLFQHIFSAAKVIRSTTLVGTRPISLAYAVTFLAKRIFADLKCLNVLFIGAGETISPIAKHLHTQKVQNIWIGNRTVSKAKQLGAQLNAVAIDFSQINHYLPQADIVICATASPIPILGKGAIESALKLRKHRPMLLVDLAVPRDIEAEVEALEDVYFYTLEHLKTIINDNFSNRIQAAEEAEKIVDIQTARFMRHLKSLEAANIIKSFRAKIEDVYDQELQWALKKLQTGESAEAVLTRMGKRLTNKFMHQPMVKLRQTSGQGKTDLFEPMQTLFNLQLLEE
jgi:glutamyl-tRNA reductase